VGSVNEWVVGSACLHPAALHPPLDQIEHRHELLDCWGRARARVRAMGQGLDWDLASGSGSD
jgi:hypothetical protein